MWLRQFFLFVTLNLFTSAAFANYLPLKNAGLLPVSFQPGYFKKAFSLFQANKKLTFGETNDARQYYHDNQYFLRDLILSSEVIYGDAISLYMQTQADSIALVCGFKKKPLVYLMRSSETNAFATQTGAIFLTTALIANMDNIYQVIYILCHELAHVEKDHMYEEFIERKEIYYTYSRLKIDERISSYYIHSQQTEFEADSLGYRYYETMKYPRPSALHSLEKLDSSGRFPFYEYRFDSTLSLDAIFPDVKITRSDVSPNNKGSIYFEKTHPDFVDRFEKIIKMSAESENTLNRLDSEDDFIEFKKIASNENLYSHYLEYDYFQILAYYHLSDHRYCDKEFVKFLYAKSLYALLKIRLFVSKERLKYDANVSMFEVEGPLAPWIKILEPQDYQGPERIFLKQLKKMSIAEMWMRTAESLLDVNSNSTYFKSPMIFDDCMLLADSLQIDSVKFDIDTSEFKSIYSRLDSTSNRLTETIKEANQSIPIFILPYTTNPASSSLEQSKINYDYYDSLIFHLFIKTSKAFGLDEEIISPAHLKTTEEMNKYSTLYSVLLERRIFHEFDSYPCSPPETDLLGYTKIRRIRIFQKIGALLLVAADYNFVNGKIENYTEIEMRTSEDTRHTMTALVKKYYKEITTNK